MNLQQLATFCAILNEGSMTAAAEKLFLTQPAVSQQIRNLEEELGVELLVRGVRHVKPTLHGQLLYEYAKKIMHLTKQAEVAIQSMKSEVKGKLVIGTLNSIGMYLVSPLVGLFLKTNSQITLSLEYGSGAEILEAMKRGELDVAIMPDVVKEYGGYADQYEEKTLFKDEVWLVVSARDAAVPSSIDVSGLVENPMVRLKQHFPAFESFLNKQLEQKNIKLNPVIETTNVGSLKRVIESGFGWGFLPAHSIRKQVTSGRLARVDVADLNYSFNVKFYTRKDSQAKAASEVLYRALQHNTAK
ncbi:MAG: LysR family transcriptional regulator [Proteobacteria bacterium SG_bin7]|nr:MAG: LysR family transcriptional regulator [Proteobacteria bacterium SG_bin7]